MIPVSFWLTSVTMIISRSIHVAVNGIILLLWVISNCIVYTHTHCIFFIHSSVNGHLGCFYVLAIVNSAAMGVCISFHMMVFSRYSPRRGISGSYSNSIFKFLRSFHNVFHRDFFFFFPKGLSMYLRAKWLESCLTLCNPVDCSPPGSSVHGHSPGKNTRVGCHFLLQEIFLIQGSNSHLLCLLHWQAGSLPLGPPGKPCVP